MTRAIILTCDVESEEDLAILANEVLDACAALPVTDAKPWSPHNPLPGVPAAAGGLLPPIQTQIT